MKAVIPDVPLAIQRITLAEAEEKEELDRRLDQYLGAKQTVDDRLLRGRLPPIEDSDRFEEACTNLLGYVAQLSEKSRPS
jgi:hypothetical protein